MSTIASTGTSLSSTYYLQKYYSSNRSAIKSTGRTDFSDVELSYEDSRALTKAAKTLSSFEYTSEENGSNIYSSIMAFVDTYNNTMDSAKDTDTESSNRYAKKLKNLMKEYSDEFEDIGITVNNDGTLTANSNLVKASSVDDIKKVFGEESGLTKTLKNISKKMNSAAYNDVYAAVTNSGLHINITL